MTDIQVGDSVYRLTMNGKPMTASNGAYKIRGTVRDIRSDRTAIVDWIARGSVDPRTTIDSFDSLRKVTT